MQVLDAYRQQSLSVNVLSGGTASVNLLSGRMLSDSTKSGGLPSVYSLVA